MIKEYVFCFPSFKEAHKYGPKIMRCFNQHEFSANMVKPQLINKNEFWTIEFDGNEEMLKKATSILDDLKVDYKVNGK